MSLLAQFLRPEEFSKLNSSQLELLKAHIDFEVSNNKEIASILQKKVAEVHRQLAAAPKP
jgi:hypothetical protein